MIIGLGIDITELDRIQKVWERHGHRFAKRILHENEWACLQQKIAPKPESETESGTESKLKKSIVPINFLAARFAVKEAAVKALGTGFSEGIGPCDIEVYSLPSGQPMLRFHSHAAKRLEAMGVTEQNAHVSLTHGRDTAAAVVILEKH